MNETCLVYAEDHKDLFPEAVICGTTDVDKVAKKKLALLPILILEAQKIQKQLIPKHGEDYTPDGSFTQS